MSESDAERLVGRVGLRAPDVGHGPSARCGQLDEHRTTVAGVGDAGDQPPLDQPVDHLRRRPGRDAQPVGEVGEAQAGPQGDDEQRAALVRREVPGRQAVAPHPPQPTGRSGDEVGEGGLGVAGGQGMHRASVALPM